MEIHVRHVIDTLPVSLAPVWMNPSVTRAFPTQTAMPSFGVSLMTTWTYSGTYSLVIGGMRRHDPHVSSLQFGCWCCMWLYAPVCSHFRYLKNLMKVHLRGPALYNKKGALFQEESYLPRIFRSSSLNLHTFSSHSHCILMANFLS